MKPFTIKCNQCQSEDVFFYIPESGRYKKLVIYCDHCPANFEIMMTPNTASTQTGAIAPEKERREQMSLFENQSSA